MTAARKDAAVLLPAGSESRYKKITPGSAGVKKKSGNKRVTDGNHVNSAARCQPPNPGNSDFLAELVRVLARAIAGNRPRLATAVAGTLARHWPEGGVV